MPRSHARLALIAASGLALALSSAARAQSPDKPADPKEPVVAKAKPAGPSKINRYAKVLNLDKAQTDAAKELYEAYQQESAAAGKKMREAIKDAQDDMNEGDRAAFEAKIQKSMAEQTAVTGKLTDTLLSDLRSLLTPAQADRWPSFERYRRREQYLNGMMMIGNIAPGGSAVDLFPLIDKLNLPSDLKSKADEQLALYEVDMDRPLKERQQNFDDEQKRMGAVQHFDGDAFAKKQERDRTVDMAIREVNTKYFRQIAAVLPSEWARKLDEAYQARAYRSIYKESNVSRKLAAAQQLKDLSADQKKQLQSLIDRYKKDAKAANDRWAAAQRAAEDAGRPTGGGLMFVGPGSSGAEKLDPDFAAARNARKDLDNATRDALEKALTPEQLAAIPQPQPNVNGARRVAVFGDHTGEDMVFVDDIDMPDDMEPGAGGGGGAAIIVRTVEVGGPGHGNQGGTQGQGGADQPRPTSKP